MSYKNYGELKCVVVKEGKLAGEASVNKVDTSVSLYCSAVILHSELISSSLSGVVR